MRPLRLPNGGSPWLLPRPDRVLRRHLGDNDLLPNLRDAEEEAGGGPTQVPQQRYGEGSVRLPGSDVGGGLLEGLRVLRGLPSRYVHTHLDATVVNEQLFVFWVLILASFVFGVGRGHQDPAEGGRQQVQILLPDREANRGGGRIRRFL